MAGLLITIAVVSLFFKCSNETVLPKMHQTSEKDVKNGVLEGDIIMDKKLEKFISVVRKSKNATSNRRGKRNAIRYEQQLWPNAVVPYVIDHTVDFSTRRTIQLAMQEFHEISCLWFIPRRNEIDYVRIISANGCYSKIGRQGGEQLVSVGLGCKQKSTIMHELMHVIGFFHENSRFDRDYFVKVLWWNIQPGAEKNFLTYHHGKIDTLQMPYDIASIMHYDKKAFTKNFKDTLQAIENPNARLGGVTFTKIDIKQILLLYQCDQPIYRKRQVICQDRRKTGCLIFLTYPKLCNVHSAYAVKFCRRTCRVCEASNFYK